MRRLLLILACSSLLVIAAIGPASGATSPARQASAGTPSASPQAAASRSCGSFGSRYRYHVTIVKGHVYCRTARRVLKAFLSGAGTEHGHGPQYKHYWTLYGWRCGRGAGGGGCIRHGRDYRTARDYILAESR